MDFETKDDRFDTLVFQEDANDHFVARSMKELLEEKDRKTLSIMLERFFVSQKERLEVLDDYSRGNNTSILTGRRRMEREKADYRIHHNIGGYISNIITGFTFGNPVTITYDGGSDDGETNDLEDIRLIAEYNDLATLDHELGFDASRYGRAFELHYRDENKEDAIVLVDPKEMFVVRSADVKKEMIGAVHCPVYNGKLYLTIYTNDSIYSYEPQDFTAISQFRFRNEQVKPHLYGEVPVVEWWNNRFRSGDFEGQISSIDAYDAAQSDTANYMSDLNDAILVIKGDLDSLGLDATTLAVMKDANLMALGSGISMDGKQTNVDAEYIYKQYDVAGTEAYKDRILGDIFRFANVPDLEDDRFYSGNSGIALEYKLIGLKQIQSTKQAFFSKALAKRYRLIDTIHEALNDVPIDSTELGFVFHPNIPKDVWYEIDNYIKAGGFISQETLRTISSFTDHRTEQERLDAEDEINQTDGYLAYLEMKRDEPSGEV